MTKTIELQVGKTSELIRGLRDNLGELASRGVNVEAGELDALESNLNALLQSSNECEALRKELSAKVKVTNEELRTVKDKYLQLKKGVKENFLQEEWQRFGVSDKR